MHTSVNIVDYSNDRKIFLVFVDEDFNQIIADWNKRNGIDSALQSITNIHHNKMSVLCIQDWKLSIISILERVLQIESSEHASIDNIQIKYMHLLLVGFSYKYFLETGNNLDYLRIQKISENNYSFTVDSSDLIISLENNNAT